jgi:hypothetical protein
MADAVTTDAVTRFRAATQTADIDALMETLAPDATLTSPVSGRLKFRGHDDLRPLLTAVYRILSAMRWTEQIGDGARQVLLGEAKVGPFRMTEAMVIELDDDGRIRLLNPHLRPWPALTFLAIRLAPSLLEHPGVLRRAARG